MDGRKRSAPSKFWPQIDKLYFDLFPIKSRAVVGVCVCLVFFCNDQVADGAHRSCTSGESQAAQPLGGARIGGILEIGFKHELESTVCKA